MSSRVAQHTGALGAALCHELAVVAQESIAGYSDDRPVSASLVRSRLTNALTGAPPVLVLAHHGEKLTGWCAVRQPEPSEPRARLWGPVVAPAARGTGLGAELLHAVVEAVDWPLVTTDVPADRPGAAAFFTRAGWHQRDTINVLHGTPTTEPEQAAAGTVTADTHPELEEYVARAAQRYGGHEPGFADATLRRWRDDARFRPENLLLHPATGSLLLALAQRNSGASELLLAEVWAEPAARQLLIRSSLAAAGRQRLEMVRAVTRGDPAGFTACSMRAAGICHTYTPPADH